MEYRERILEIAKTTPVLPSIIAKALATNSIMAGAMLSEMCSKGILKTSALKVGGSPLYYVPGNEVQLLNYLQSMNEKDRRTVLKLKEEKIIRETEADPLTQVSLAQIKDFAKPLIVAYQDKQERFWKWFELTDKEAEEQIRQKLAPIAQPELPKTQPEPPAKPLPEIPKSQPKQETLAPKPETPPTGDFWQKAHEFFTQNNITIQQQTTVKKKTEFDLTITIPSPVGTLTYYCKARNKKKITDADISSAYVQGQIQKLPVIFLTDGELTKQAKHILTQLKGITVKQV